MPVKIRLQRKGRRKRPFYHIVIADSRAPRDGRFIEKIGTYNPMTNPATIDLDRDAAFDWLQKGAQPTNTVRAILRFNGVLYRKHLQRGVAKGALTQEDADKLYQEWVGEKDEKTATRFEATAKEKAARISKISGTPPPPPKVEEPEPEETVEQTVETIEETAETAPAAEPAVVDAPEAVTPAEEAPAAEDPVAKAANEAAPVEAEKIAAEAEVTEEAAEAVAEALEENPQGAEDVAPEADGDEKKEDA
ncbi:30S ribosomal protein S16 [Lewinellaceae bacterium SD302]|nr:30S ribosomal protein S16 [Lewinellaceae bacterium SD302]